MQHETVAVSEGDGNVLEVRDLQTGYPGRPVVFGASFRAEPGRVTALLGHNGAGKTTTLKAIAGLLPVHGGSVRIQGEDIGSLKASDRVKRGVVYLPQDRAVFADLSVAENLRLGASLTRDEEMVRQRRTAVLELFPDLEGRLDQLAGTMSGGQQRMVSMGIALMAGAKFLLLDEPSLGLAPFLIQDLLRTVADLARREGMAVVLVEQAIAQALEFADHVYVMRNGEIVADHTRQEALDRHDWWKVF